MKLNTVLFVDARSLQLASMLAVGVLLGSCRDKPAPTPAAQASASSSSSTSTVTSAAPVRSLPSASPGTVACRPGALQTKPVAELESLSAKGDLCAKAELGPHLFTTNSVASFRRGAALVKEAFQGGANVSACYVFVDGVGMAPDWDLGLACLQRAEDRLEQVLHLINGDGKTRFLDRAEQLINSPPALESKDYLLGLLKEERSKPSQKVYKYCEMASTTMEMLHCGMRERFLTRWRALEKRGPAVEALKPEHRAVYDQLVAAFEKYRDSDVDHLSYFYVDAHSVSNLMPGARRSALEKEFNDLFEQIVVQRSAAAMSKQDLDKAKQELAEAEKRATETRDKNDRYDPAKHRALWAASRASWDRYRGVWLKLATALAGNDDEAVRTRMEVLLLRARVATLQTGFFD